MKTGKNLSKEKAKHLHTKSLTLRGIRGYIKYNEKGFFLAIPIFTPSIKK